MYICIYIYIYIYINSSLTSWNRFALTPSPSTTNFLACTRDSFTYFCVCKNQPSLHYPRPSALPTLLQYDCTPFTQYKNSPRPFLYMKNSPRHFLYMPYTIYYW